MKIFFTKDDTLYKIMKSIEKLPKGKKIAIYIDYQNSFFSHPRWGKQILGLMDEKNIDYVFICKHPKAKAYFESHSFPYEYDAPNRFMQGIHMLGLLFFNAKKFHLSLFTKKGAFSYLMIIGEIIAIMALIFVMYQFLVPSATVYINPTFSVEDMVYNFRFYEKGTALAVPEDEVGNISVPFSLGTYTHTHTLTVPVISLQYLSSAAKGEVIVTNTVGASIPIKQGTRFVTNEGLQFTADNGFTLPPGSESTPSRVRVALTAAERDESSEIQGERGNIGSGTRLLIRNLNQSYLLGAIYANASADFTGGETKREGAVGEQDFAFVRERLMSGLTGDNRRIILQQNFTIPDAFLLPFSSYMKIESTSFTFNAMAGDVVESIEGTVVVQYTYPYVLRSDLESAIKEYVRQRPSNIRQLISIQRNSIVFYDPFRVDPFIVQPIKVSTVRGYDFVNDATGIVPLIKEAIAGTTIPKAKEEIIKHPEVSSVEIKTSPKWADTLPSVQSRIRIRTVSNVE